MDQLSELFASLPQTKKSTTVLALPPSAAQVYNFFCTHLERKTVAAYSGLNEGYDPGLQPLPCEDINELLTAIKKKIKISVAAEEAILVMMAVAISLEVDGPFLWMHVTGPSSSLKTTILDMLGSAYDKVFTTTEFTSFYSGSTYGGKDNSLLPQLQGKVFIIKDLTPLLQSNRDDQNLLFGQMRAIYDGTGEKFYNNGVHHDFKNVRFVCLTGVTYVIYSFMRTDMGERFLITDINSIWTSDGRLQKIEAELGADGNAYDSLFDTIAGGFADDGPKLDQLDIERRMCWGLFNHLIEYMQDEAHGLRSLAKIFRNDRSIKNEIDALAVWMEHARCRVPSKGEDSVRVSPAEPHRSIKQLSKLAMCIAIVTKATSVTDQIRHLVKKVAFDTARSFSLEIMNYLATWPHTSKKILASKMHLSDTKVASVCAHLISIGVIEEVWGPTATGSAGHPSLCYKLTLKFRMIADVIGLKEQSLKAPPAELSPAQSELAQLFASLQKSHKSF